MLSKLLLNSCQSNNNSHSSQCRCITKSQCMMPMVAFQPWLSQLTSNNNSSKLYTHSSSNKCRQLLRQLSTLQRPRRRLRLH